MKTRETQVFTPFSGPSSLSIVFKRPYLPPFIRLCNEIKGRAEVTAVCMSILVFQKTHIGSSTYVWDPASRQAFWGAPMNNGNRTRRYRR